MSAVVLAGGPHDAIATLTPGAPNKAFVHIAGKPLVQRTLEALRSASCIGRIVVVAPLQTHAMACLEAADEYRVDGPCISASLRSGLSGLPADEAVLVSTSDLPVLTAQATDDFVERAARTGADLCYGCVEKTVHLRAFPDVPHTWARLRDGSYCGTGFITLRPRVLPSLERFIERLGAARKNPLRLASLFGCNVLVSYALRRLSIAMAEQRASNVVGARVRAVVTPFAETAVNVDRVSDVALAERLILRS